MYLGLDIGTTATKAVLVDEHHAIVATATAGYSLYQPTPEIAGRGADHPARIGFVLGFRYSELSVHPASWSE